MRELSSDAKLGIVESTKTAREAAFRRVGLWLGLWFGFWFGLRLGLWLTLWLELRLELELTLWLGLGRWQRSPRREDLSVADAASVTGLTCSTTQSRVVTQCRTLIAEPLQKSPNAITGERCENLG